MMRREALALLVMGFLVLPVSGLEIPVRLWTSGSGSEMSGRVVRFYPAGEVAMLQLEREGGKVVTLRVDQLSKGDQDHLWNEYIHCYGARRASPKSAVRAEPVPEEQRACKLEWHPDLKKGVDLDFLFGPPRGAKLDRGSLPPNGDRSGDESWGNRTMVSHVMWWTVSGLLDSRHRYDAERLEKEITRDVERSIKGDLRDLEDIAVAMERYLGKRVEEVESLRGLRLMGATIEDLSALAREQQMVLIKVKAYNEGRYEWAGETLLRTAGDDGKISLLLWDEVTEGTLELIPPVKAARGPSPFPQECYRLVLDPLDRSSNAEHLKDEGWELRIGAQGRRENMAIVLSPKFRPPAGENEEK